MPPTEPDPESEKYNVLEEQIRVQLDLKASTWFAGLVDLDAIPFPRAERMIYKFSSYYSSLVGAQQWTGDSEELELIIGLPDKASWRQIAVCADKAIFFSGDRHHCYIEGFIDHGEFIELETGS